MTIIASNQLECIVDEIWTTVLSSSAKPLPNNNQDMDEGLFCGGYINISGDFEGGVTVQTTQEHAYMIAATIFGKEAKEVDQSETRDIIGEITNMIGGHVKAMLPDNARYHCLLSMKPCSTTIST